MQLGLPSDEQALGLQGRETDVDHLSCLNRSPQFDTINQGGLPSLR
jgi:hypothetical protein